MCMNLWCVCGSSLDISLNMNPVEPLHASFEIILVVYDSSVSDQRQTTLPNLLCIITGKGPLKAYYEGLIATMHLPHVRILTMWLTAEDYPRLLGCSDLGVSLHTSSSGLDLPMKVVDMFGAGLPVVAANFDCISELVKHRENGLVFKSSEELCSQLTELLSDFTTTQDGLHAQLRRSVMESRVHTWTSTWNSIAYPIVHNIISK